MFAGIGAAAHRGIGGARIDAVNADIAGVIQFVGEGLHQPFGGEFRYGVGSPVGAAFAADAGGGEDDGCIGAFIQQWQQGFGQKEVAGDVDLQYIIPVFQTDLRNRFFLAENAGVDGAVVAGKIRESNDLSFGFNAQTEEYGDMFAFGVIDPAKVTRTALEDAASVASLLITTEAMIADRPAKESAGGAGGMGGMGGMDGMM